jgi:hypothetical protein
MVRTKRDEEVSEDFLGLKLGLDRKARIPRLFKAKPRRLWHCAFGLPQTHIYIITNLEVDCQPITSRGCGNTDSRYSTAIRLPDCLVARLGIIQYIYEPSGEGNSRSDPSSISLLHLERDPISTFMCDISTSIIFWALSPIPGFHYIGLGLVVTSFIIYAANHQSPSYKLSQLEDKIKIVEETLKDAREKCARDHVELLDGARRLLK